MPSRKTRRITTGNTFWMKNQNTARPSANTTTSSATPPLSEPVMEAAAATAVTTMEPEVI